MINRKLKLALAALLGFSAACSTVRQAPNQTEKSVSDAAQTAAPEQQPADTVGTTPQPERPRVVLMYGVRPPKDSLLNRRFEQQRPDSLPPVAEAPFEEDTPTVH